MANLSHDAVVSAFEKRYDHQSARNVLKQALKEVGLAAKDSYSDAELAQLTDGLKALGERETDGIIEALSGGDDKKGKDDKGDDKKGKDAKGDDKKKKK